MMMIPSGVFAVLWVQQVATSPLTKHWREIRPYNFKTHSMLLLVQRGTADELHSVIVH